MKELRKYVADICREQYGFSEEDTEAVVETVVNYAEGKKLTSLNEVEIYLDGLLTNLDINTGEL